METTSYLFLAIKTKAKEKLSTKSLDMEWMGVSLMLKMWGAFHGSYGILAVHVVSLPTILI